MGKRSIFAATNVGKSFYLCPPALNRRVSLNTVADKNAVAL